MRQISAVATLVTRPALEDFELLLFTLNLWNSTKPRLYVFTDAESKLAVVNAVAKLYPNTQVNVKTALDAYTGLTRADMERRPGRSYATLFGDFTAEKTTLMEWALESEPEGVLFCDADICHMAPLPVIPEGSELALSPHMIRAGDAAKYGYYNAGYLWIRNPKIVREWREACATSRFFEQACLEDLAAAYKPTLYEFPIQVNYGWWRLWQGMTSPDKLQTAWSFFRPVDGGNSGLLVEGLPLQSIHTHWYEKNDAATYAFNQWVLEKLRKLSSLKKTKQLTQRLDQRPSQN